jgi:hypothetical protein
LAAGSIGRFRVVDEQNLALASDLLHPVGKARESFETFLNRGGIDAERCTRCDRASRVLSIVHAA